MQTLSVCSNAAEISLNQVQSFAPTSVYVFNFKLSEESTGTLFPFDVLHAKQPF